VRLGVLILPEFRWPVARERWRRAEELGFDHAWTYDHLAWRTLRDAPWFGAIPTLTAAVTATERIRLGTLVASPNFRHPVPFARELITVDDVSAGRFTLGLGAGGGGWDASVLGHDPWSQAERTGRFAEFVELLDRLLREPATSFDGRYYRAVEARTYPGCVQRPRIPFAVAASGTRAMHVAATYGDTWVTVGDVTDPDAARRAPLPADKGAPVVATQSRALDDICVRLGRDPATLARLVLAGPLLDGGVSSARAFEDSLGRYAEVGVTDFVVHWPRPEGPYAGDAGLFERIVSEVAGR
jgi:alkanesulfonate monooxygenase SsuD/methylene tetrahydromethanopterin reductase-like flavin-dependent oxidoreductase (luciferase family)